MATVMNMSSYAFEAEEVPLEQYDDEVLSAGWNPQLELVGNRPIADVDKHKTYASEMSGVDLDDFLQLMYRCQP